MLDHKLHGYVGIETPAERHMTAKDVVGSGCSCGRTDLDAADFKSAWKNDARIVDRIASCLPAAEYFERIEPDFRQPVRKCASILCSCFLRLQSHRPVHEPGDFCGLKLEAIKKTRLRLGDSAATFDRTKVIVGPDGLEPPHPPVSVLPDGFVYARYEIVDAVFLASSLSL